MSLSLRGARTLLTGATGGIGHALAHRLADEGADLVLTGRRVEVLAPLAEQTGGHAVAADLADPSGVEGLLDQSGEIDLLVANAALPGTGRFDVMSPDEIERNLRVNLHAPIALTRAVLPAMLERDSGHVVLIGSLSGVVASPGSALYNATKFGLRGFATALRQDLHGTGVGLTIVEPGFVSEAGMFVNSGMELPRGARTVTPEQVADGVVDAIRRNRGEVMVAPAELRAGARIGGLLPGLNAYMQRKAGAADIVAAHAGSGAR